MDANILLRKLFTLEQTSGACPEQYNITLTSTGEYVGFMHLRNGYFYVQYLGDVVYEGNPRGDGIFEEDERDFYINNGLRVIKEALPKYKRKINV